MHGSLLIQAEQRIWGRRSLGAANSGPQATATSKITADYKREGRCFDSRSTYQIMDQDAGRL